MKLTVNKEYLLKSLSTTMKAISSKTTLPVLTGMLITASNKEVTLVGSDVDMSIISSIPLAIDDEVIANVEEEGKIVIPAKILNDIVKNLASNEVTIHKIDDVSVKISSGTAEYKLIGWDAKEYPKLPKNKKISSFKIEENELKKLIDATLFAAADSEAQPILTGVHLVMGKDSITGISTDSHRLSKKTALITEVTAENEMVTIPKNALNEISKILTSSKELIEIATNESQVIIKLTNTTVFSRLLVGNYPNVSGLIPNSATTAIKLNKKAFQDMVTRARILAEVTNQVVTLRTMEAGQIELSSKTASLGTVKETVDAISIEGEEINLSFSAKYISDALKALDGDEITIYLVGNMRPFIIRGNGNEEALQLILPVRTV